MSRLYLRFYAALLGSLIVFALAAGFVLHRMSGPPERFTGAAGTIIQNALPPVDAPPLEQQHALERLLAGSHADITLRAPNGAPIAAVRRDDERELPHPGDRESALTFRLPDGRSLTAHATVEWLHPIGTLLLGLTILALAVGVGAYPIVRRLTKRLERLERGVESLGAGDLAARVPIEGQDEVARLAQSFNRAAGRIEALVGAHKTLLANASHELRTPLARIRMAVEMLKESADPKRKAGLDLDIAELDQIIDEVMLASRLDAVTELEADETVDLVALAAEECARYPQAQLDGTAVSVRGDPRLLRRMLRNLLENAQRHGAPPVRVQLERRADAVQISVCDAGPGIPAEERERVFEPFYRRKQSGANSGAGLGLALVRQIARRHGGDARCEPDASAASRFVVQLPVRMSGASEH
jgi:signal transduction histidine kinase